MSITPQSLWRLRLRREMPRYLLCACALAGLLASLRFTIAPPSGGSGPPAATRPLFDRPAAAFAAEFARRYLTWAAVHPQASADALASYAGTGIEPGVGFTPPLRGEEKVEWAEVVQERQQAPREHVFTVAAQTDSTGLVYLSVSVARDPEGNLYLSRYPAFVGPPSAVAAPTAARAREVTDSSLATVAQRAMRNYLAGAQEELQADLAIGARVSYPAQTLELQSVARLDWSTDGRSVVAVLQARDARGATYTLAYELDVTRLQGRWEVSAVQMEPNQ